MMNFEIPEFSSWKEEAEFWDNFDTSALMETTEGEWVGPSRVKPAPGLCPNCGAEMAQHFLDMKIAHGRIIVHEVLFFVCPRCGERTLPLETQEFVAWTE